MLLLMAPLRYSTRVVEHIRYLVPWYALDTRWLTTLQRLWWLVLQEQSLEQQLRLYDMWTTIVNDYEAPFSMGTGRSTAGGSNNAADDDNTTVSSQGNSSMNSARLFRVNQTRGRTEVVRTDTHGSA